MQVNFNFKKRDGRAPSVAETTTSLAFSACSTAGSDGRFGPALFAGAEELVKMARQLEAKAFRDIQLKQLDRLELELHDLAAARADQVVVVLSLECSLVAGPVAGGHQRDLKQPRFDEQR